MCRFYPGSLWVCQYIYTKCSVGTKDLSLQDTVSTNYFIYFSYLFNLRESAHESAHERGHMCAHAREGGQRKRERLSSRIHTQRRAQRKVGSQVSGTMTRAESKSPSSTNWATRHSPTMLLRLCSSQCKKILELPGGERCASFWNFQPWLEPQYLHLYLLCTVFLLIPHGFLGLKNESYRLIEQRKESQHILCEK